MKVSIMQPAYLPWLGYFDRIFQSDLHIVLDNVAIDRSSKTKFANRNKIRTAQGSLWLTVPLAKKENTDLYLDTLKINNDQSWQKKHWLSIKGNYTKAPFFQEHHDFFDQIYTKNWERLFELTQETTHYLLDALSIDTEIVLASKMNLPFSKSELILELCKNVCATTYISGPFGREYLDEGSFLKAGIKLEYHDYQHPIYKQRYSDFEPYMSVIDLLFNLGPAAKATLVHCKPVS